MTQTEYSTRQIDFRMGNHTLDLLVSDDLFLPCHTTQLFPKAVERSGINLDRRTVIDMGAGVGPNAIYAAKEDASAVYACEIVPEQVELLRQNAERNNVPSRVKIYGGSFFEPLPKGVEANVILSDCSGIDEDVARASGWYPNAVPCGGSDGADNVCEVLTKSKDYLSQGASLFFPVGKGLSNRPRILSTAHDNFESVVLRVTQRFPLAMPQKDAILAALDGKPYKSDLEEKGARVIWHAEIYEARHPR